MAGDGEGEVGETGEISPSTAKPLTTSQLLLRPPVMGLRLLLPVALRFHSPPELLLLLAVAVVAVAVVCGPLPLLLADVELLVAAARLLLELGSGDGDLAGGAGDPINAVCCCGVIVVG